MTDPKTKNRRCVKQTSKDHTYIYALSHPVTGEIRYIGKTCRSIEYRLYEHLRDSQRNGRSTAVLSWIKNVVADGLLPNIVVLEIVAADEDWREAETRVIAHHRQYGRLLNLSDGGDGARGALRSDETKAKLSAIAKAQGRKPPGNKGRVFGEQARANMAAAHIGKSVKQSPEACQRRRGPCPSRRWTPEHRAKLMASRKNYVTTEEHKRSLSEAGKRAWAKRKGLPLV